MRFPKITKSRAVCAVVMSATLLGGALGATPASAATHCGTPITQWDTSGQVCSEDFSVEAGQEREGLIASFGVSGPYAFLVSATSAIVDWGDGSLTTFWPYYIVGAHTYAAAGTYTVTTSVETNYGTVTSSGTATVASSTEPFITGSGTRPVGGSFALDVQRASDGAPSGTATITGGGETVSGTITCASVRSDGKNKYLGKRAVIGIQTDERKPRYVEFYVQDLAAGGDRIVRTGTSRAHRYTAPPAGCYHTAPPSIQGKHKIKTGDITIAAPVNR